MNSNFNKSMLWVVMLSAISQAYPMGSLSSNAAKVASRVGVGTAFALPSAGFAFVAGRNANVGTAFAEQAPEATQNVAEVVEVPVSTEAIAEAKTIAQRASEKVAQGKAVVLDSYTSCKNFVVDKATDKEFLAQGFCGMVTVGSISYLVHKSGVAVKIKNNWKRSLIGAGVVASALAGVAYMYPEVALNVAKSALNASTNPYTALATGAVAAGVCLKSYNRPKTGAAVAATAGLVGAANRFGYMDWAKNGVSFAANKVKDAALWTAKNGYDYTVAPVVAQAVKHPYIAGGVATAVAVPAIGFGAYKGVQAYKAWKKPAKNQRKVTAPTKPNTPATRTAPTNTAPAGQTQAPNGRIAKVKKAVQDQWSGITAAKSALPQILENVLKSFSLTPDDAKKMNVHVDLLAAHGIEVKTLVNKFKTKLIDYNNSPAGRTKNSLALELNMILGKIKSSLQ